MALAKERAVTQKNLQHLGSIQSYSCYGNAYGGSSIQLSDPSLGFLGLESYHKAVLEEGDGTERICSSLKNLVATNHALSDLHDVDGSGEFMLGAINSPNEIQSLLNFKTGTDHWIYSSGSVLSFDQGDQLSHSHPVHPKIGHADDHSIWVDPVDHNNESNQVNSKCGIDSRLIEDMNCFETASGFSPMTNACNDGQHGEAQCGWLYTGALADDGHHGPEELDGCYHKRPFSGGDHMPALKKHCGSPQKKSKPKPIPSRDPQSIAAKNRRERISERLKILQDLVPNGTKVDLVTMLEKAISYVKFLQLQVKVLATDEFWPAQGGKAPEVAQVKEAIDAILSSHRDRNSSSK